MPELRNLDGVKINKRECKFISKSSEIKKILNSGLAVTAADVNGSFNIWEDDEGFIRCEVFRYMRTLDKQKFVKIKDVKTWAKKWLKEIK